MVGDTGEMPIVHLRHLNHYYGAGDFRKQALLDVNLDLMPGEIMIMTGPSGSGKTTLLTLIGALRSVQEGQTQVLGHELRHLSHHGRVEVRRRIGFIFQLHNLFDALNGFQNVMMGLELHAYQRREKHRLVTEVLTDLGLAHRMHAKPQAMSGGERQRVAIARALVAQPKLILADEPTAALDHDTGREVVNRLQHLANIQQAAVIIVTHDNRILDIADRIVNLVDGQVVSNVQAQESVAICEFLMQCPIFSETPLTALTELADRITCESYPDRARIIRQGDMGETFYIVRKGTVRVTQDDGTTAKVVSLLGVGGFFGETALLTGNVRNATVEAVGPVELYALGKRDFQNTLTNSPPFQQQIIRTFFQRT